MLCWCGAASAQPFVDEIRAFKHSDSLHFPPAHANLFVGSSSLRMWTSLQQDFAGYPVINRGFGGSTLPDVIRYANDIIFPYHPSQILIYCGDNDFAVSDTVSVATVVGRFETLFRLIRSKLPNTPVVFISIKPSPSRQQLMSKMAAANAQIRSFLKTQRHAKFIDVYSLMLGADGLPRPELFREDRLHMTAKGYAIWQKAIRPVLKK